MVYIIFANICYVLSVFVSIKRLSANYAPTAFFCNLFVNGFICLNLIFSRIAFGYYIDDIVFLLYSIVPTVSSLLFIIFSFSKIKRDVVIDSYDKNATTIIEAKKFAFIYSVPFFFVAVKIFLVGFFSGADLFSDTWRSEISNSLRGAEFLIYNSGSILLSFYLGYIAKPNFKNAVMIAIYITCLLIYGGRFLFGIAIIIGIYMKYIRNMHYMTTKRMFLYSFSIIAFIVLMAFVRYSNFGMSSSYSLNLLFLTFCRQLSGNVYDFQLSYMFVNKEIAFSIIVEKLRVALLPMFSQYNLSETLGHYLAVSADRPFEHGHRISVIGEIYYLAGFAGVVSWAFFIVFFCNWIDKYAIVSKNKYIIIVVFLFSLSFTFFVDSGYLFTGFYLYVYSSIVVKLSKYTPRFRVLR